jgi:hypothetical protein
MANEIETAGKAMARGYAAREVYKNNYSPIAAIFFSRACELSGESDIHNIEFMASMNSVGDDQDAIEEAYRNIPVDKQPASRRNLEASKTFKTVFKYKTNVYNLLSLGKINVVKGTGPQFDASYVKYGTIEVWMTNNNKYRIIYTGNSDSTANLGCKRDFKFDNKREIWTCVDYIEVYNMTNLMPLYGTSITAFMYN